MSTQNQQEQKPNKDGTSHDQFKSGQGYGSGEKESEAQAHPRKEQYGDNPTPPSGGNWGSSGKNGN